MKIHFVCALPLVACLVIGLTSRAEDVIESESRLDVRPDTEILIPDPAVPKDPRLVGGGVEFESGSG